MTMYNHPLQKPVGAEASPSVPTPARPLRARPESWVLGVTLLIASLFSACATHSPNYVEPPASIPSAKVRVVNTRPYAYYADIAIFDAAACFDRADLGMTGGNSKDRVRIGMLDDKPVSPATLERLVRADEALVIGPRAVFPTATVSEILHALTPEAQEASRARQAGVCRIPSFVPKANEQYEVVVDLTPAHCSVVPYHLVGSKGSVEREPVESHLSQISTYEFDMKCFK
jgi:hypothetical protein